MALTKSKGEERKLPAREGFPEGIGKLASSSKARGAQAEGMRAEVEKAKPCRTF